MEILSQIVGYIGTATAVVGFQVKARKHLLLCQIFSNLLVALSFVLLGPDKLAGGSISIPKRATPLPCGRPAFSL